MNNLVAFSDEIDLKDLNSQQFLPITLKCFADGLTRHGYYFSLDSLKKSAFTLRGKPILWGYDFFADDAAGHEVDEVPCGFVPENADISYEFDEKYNKTFVLVNGFIWVKYAERLVEIFKRTNGVKDVSVELLLYDSEPDKDNPDITNAISYCFAGITILGEAVTPAVDGAKATVVNFADEKDQFETAKMAFVEQLNHSCQNVRESEGGDKDMQNEKEITNSVNTENEQVDNAVVVDTVTVRVDRDTSAYMDNGDTVYIEDSQRHSETVVTEVPDSEIIGNSGNSATVENATSEELDNATSEEMDNACGDDKENNACGDGDKENNACGDADKVDNFASVKCAELEAKCTELQNSYDTLKAQYDELSVKCSALEEYKNNVEKANYSNAVECALADVSEYITEAEKAEWRETSLKCSSISEFTNQLKAFAFDKRQAKKSDSAISRSPLVVCENVTVNSDNIWDKMTNIYH